MLEYLITNHRWFFVVAFLMPLSIVYEMYLLMRNIVNFYFREKAPEKHEQRVAKISNSIKEWAREGRKKKMCTARPGWQTMSLRAGKYKKTFKAIKLPLHDILEIDPETRTCRVEPMVTCGQLTHSLLPLGWTLPILPELDDLTVGGLVAGVGIETSSHKYGLFQHICVSFEVVMPDGSVTVCSAEKNPDLFYCIPWSHGTLGFVVAVEIKIIPCKHYVDLVYLPYTNKKEAIQRFHKESADATFDFVECLAYSPTEYVVILGDMSEYRDDRTMNKIGLWHKPWFYKHVESILQSGAKEHRELVPLRDYYHRHTRSLFWEVQDIVPFGNNPLFRALFGWMMPPKPSLMKLTQTEALRRLYELHHVVQDMLVPMRDLHTCIDVFDETVYVYPLWLCPFKIPANGRRKSEGKGEGEGTPNSSGKGEGPVHRGLVGPTPDGEELFVDVGAYGNPVVKGFVASDACRKLEDYVRSVHGYQMMYADSYMTREEFRQMFDHSLYDHLRKTIPHCEEAFPEIYDKVSKAARI